ncbi:unnamed protein product [Mytilus coruscus]|uniref:Uncharacterized protein n=1 Tax=Mytilus coruscus TaxID=42192 RepID=A0A6J8B5Q4_MYTCO|nr:unnamed protein product [Mytilus coruscus]
MEATSSTDVTGYSTQDMEVSSSSDVQRSSVTPTLIVKLPNIDLKKRTRTRVSRATAKLRREVKTLTTEKENANRRFKKISKRYERLVKKTETIQHITAKRCQMVNSPSTSNNTCLTPRKRTMGELREERLTPSKIPKPIQDKLLLANVLTEEIGNAWNSSGLKGKILVAQIISGTGIKKYKMKKVLGIKTGIRRQNFRGSSQQINKFPEIRKNVVGRESLRISVVNFLERDDNSRVMPGKNDKKKTKLGHIQKRVLNDNLMFLHLKFKAETSRKISFATFCRLRPVHITVLVQVCEFQQHVSRVRIQYKALTNLKENLPAGNAIVQMDFAENFSCCSADEVQSAYWNSSSVTLHPVVVYYKDGDDKMAHTNYVFVSDDLGHNIGTVYTILQKLMPKIKQNINDLKKIHYWTDSPSSHARNNANHSVVGVTTGEIKTCITSCYCNDCLQGNLNYDMTFANVMKSQIRNVPVDIPVDEQIEHENETVGVVEYVDESERVGEIDETENDEKERNNEEDRRLNVKSGQYAAVQFSMKRNGMSASQGKNTGHSLYVWPSNADELWVKRDDILCEIHEPVKVGRSGRSYAICQDDIELASRLVKATLPNTCGAVFVYSENRCRGLIIESTVDKPLVVNSLAISVQNNGNKKFNFRYTSCQLTSMEDTFVKFEDIIVTITACNRVFRNDIAELPNDLDSQLGFIPDLLAYSKSDNIVKKYYFGFLRWKKWAK